MIRRMFIRYLMLLCLSLLTSCQCVGETEQKQWLEPIEPIEYSNDTISASQLGIMPNAICLITNTIDLQGKTLMLPQGVTLQNKKGGVIRNGQLIGNGTKIDSKTAIFDRVRISGSWNVPRISTSLFAHLDYDNSLKDVIALTSSVVNNQVYIEKGHFQVSATKNGDAILSLNSNTEINIDGDIMLRPNPYPNYSIIRTDGDRIQIKGKGSVCGDRNSHLGKDGEWGMGLFITGSNVTIKGITVKDCWGDCIYVRTRSEGVCIEGCKLSGGRRQGISITSAKDVAIRKCEITDVGGTAPEYAIDVEPNKGDTIGRVIIDKVVVRNCKGGICSYGRSASSKIEYISITNTTVEGASKIPYDFCASDEIVMRKNRTRNCKGSTGISYCEVSRGSILKNDIKIEMNLIDVIKNEIKSNKPNNGISIKDCGPIAVKE